MCGIAGMVGDLRPEVLRGMLQRIAHRGPDDSGYEMVGGGGFGNVRLQIIDPGAGKQPLWDSSKSCGVAYNGEIYGYERIRQELMREGSSLQTHCDTEVLLPLYQQKGLDLCRDLNGMYAFCLYDATQETFLLARDPVGIKPLVYTVLGDRLYFSSEVKSFYAVPEWEPEPDMDAWHTFLNIRFPPFPRTLFKGVRKLPPGAYLLLHRQKEAMAFPASHEHVESFSFGEWKGTIRRFYRRPKPSLVPDFEQAQGMLRSLLQEVVCDQMVADVPVGVYLSGGMDSSTVAAYAAKSREDSVRTFCLGFNEPSDENADARILSGRYQTDHKDVFLSENPLDHFRKAVYFMEEPKVNCLQGFLLSREARKYQKVILNGLGGDELFGGYDVYAFGSYLDLLRPQPQRLFARASGELTRQTLKAFPFPWVDNYRRGADILSRLNSPLDAYLLLRNAWDHDRCLREAIYRTDFLDKDVSPVRDHFVERFPQDGGLCEAFMTFEFENKMVDDFLANEDRMSMAHGLESRVPLLDRRLVEFVQPLPLAWKIRLSQRKILFRQSMKEILPASVFRKKKHGFTFDPVMQFQKDLGPLVRRVLTRERVNESGIFNHSFVEKILATEPSPRLRWHYFLLWKIMGYHLWEDVFIRNRGKIEA